MFSNPIWRVAAGIGVLMFVRNGVAVGSLAYFSSEVMKAGWVFAMALPLLSVAIFLGGLVAQPVLRLTTVRTANIVFTAASIVIAGTLPFLTTRPWLFIAAFTVSNIGSGLIAASAFILINDAVEWQRARFSNSSSGVYASSLSFSFKVGIALGASLVAFVLGWVGYNPASSTPASRAALSWTFLAGPMFVMVLQIFVLSRLPCRRITHK